MNRKIGLVANSLQINARSLQEAPGVTSPMRIEKRSLVVMDGPPDMPSLMRNW